MREGYHAIGAYWGSVSCGSKQVRGDFGVGCAISGLCNGVHRANEKNLRSAVTCFAAT